MLNLISSKLLAIGLAATLLYGAPATTQAAPFEQNLLTNPGFENDLDGWSTDNSIVATGLAHTGNGYLTSQGNADNRTSQNLDLRSAGFTEEQIDSGLYFLRYGAWWARAKTLLPGTAHLEITLVEEDGREIATEVGLIPGADWTFSEGGTPLLPGTREIQVTLYAQSQNPAWLTQVYTDDVFLEVSSDAPASIWTPDGYAVSDNLLENPGFELGLYHWTTGLSLIETRIDGTTHGGNKLLKTTGMETNATSQRIDLIAKGLTEDALDSGRLFLYFGGWVGARFPDELTLGVTQHGATGTLGELNIGWQSRNQWTLVSGGFPLKPGTRAVTFGFYAHDRNNWAGYATDAVLDDTFVILSDHYHPHLQVPLDFPTIQEALDNARSGDIIWLDDGIYEEHLVWPPMAHVTLTSLNGPEQAILDGAEADRLIFYASGSTGTIAGLTIRNGHALNGAGIKIEGSSPLIIGNRFENNVSAGNHGGAINVMTSSPRIQYNRFESNGTDSFGGAIHVGYDSAPLIQRNSFVRNYAREAGAIDAWGGGAAPIISENLFIENEASALGGAVVAWDASATLINDLFVNNLAGQGSSIYLYNSATSITNCTLTGDEAVTTALHGYNSSPVVLNSIVWPESVHFYNGGTPQIIASNIDFEPAESSFFEDPLFIGTGDYRLGESSPSIDTGRLDGAPETDLEGISRPQGAGVDMGAYERTAVTAAPCDEGTLHLAGGDLSSGRLETCHAGRWGSICDDGFGNAEAAVVCHQLGFDRGAVLYATAVTDGSGDIWLDDLDCRGDEASLAQCGSLGWGVQNCGHQNDVGVECLNEAPYGCRATPVVVTGGTFSGKTLVQSERTIGTSRTVDIRSGAEVDFEAAQAIRLEPGFRAASGSAFRARITAVSCGASRH